MDVLARLDEARAAINVLEHPFYQRWSAGELSADELARYAGEYRHAVLALADASALAPSARAADAARRRAARAAPPRRGGGARTWRCGSSSSAAVGPARVGGWPDGRRRRRRARSRRVRACARGRPVRTCSSTSRCCTRSRRASRRSRATKLEGLTRALRLQRGGTGDGVLPGPRAARRRARARGARADRAADGRGRGPRRAGRADGGARERRAARQLAAARRRRSGVGSASARRQRPRGQAPGEQHGGDGRREVEARDAGAHRNADARVGAREQLAAEAVALGAEGEHRARGQLRRARAARRRGRARAAAGRAREQRSSCSSRATGSAKCSPAAPRSASGCHGSWLPVLSTPATSAAAATRTQAPMLPRSRGSSSSDDRRRPRGRRARRRGRPADARRARSRRWRARAARAASKTAGSISRASARMRSLRSGASARSGARARPASLGEHLEHDRAEAQRVLERVEAFEHGERGVASRAPEARDQRSVLHSAIMAAPMKLEGIHHISAITGDAAGNVEFYTGVLGLRMVKRTVNQDEPNMYHLFYGDEHGSPGMDLTFFEYPGAAPRHRRRGDGPPDRVAGRLAAGARVLEGAAGSRTASTRS